MHLNKIEQWELIKRVSNWVNVSLTDSDYPLNSDHFAFNFKTKKPKDIVNFSFLLLNKKTELIKFIDGKKNHPYQDRQKWTRQSGFK